MAFTDLTVKQISPRDKRFEVTDRKGLSLRVYPSGKKVWIYRYLFDGVPRRMTLGTYPAMSLAKARENHSIATQDVANGIDPGQKQAEVKARRKASPTFSDLLIEFWEVELYRKKAGAATKRLIEYDAVPAWGKRKVSDIKRRDIVLLLDKVRERAPVGANRLHGALSRIFNFAAERGVIEDSPCVRIRKVPEKGRSRVLEDSEIKILWNALDLDNKDVDMFCQTKLALKMILLTGQRPGEVCGMQWAEIDEEATLWHIPPERSKNGEARQVPLTSMALEIIENAKALSGNKQYVFTSSHKPDAPITVRALSRALSRHWSEIKIGQKFTPHDLRRTLRTRLAELGVSDIVAECVLGHKLQGLLAVYNHHQYTREMRDALNKWEHKLSHVLVF
ncbi:MAG: tyrosine-type recombinase/integrase [Desulfosalsimonas sp.]